MSRGSPRGGGKLGEGGREGGGGRHSRANVVLSLFAGTNCRVRLVVSFLSPLFLFPFLPLPRTSVERASEQGMATKKGGSSVMRSLLRYTTTTNSTKSGKVVSSLSLRLFMTFGATPDFNGSGRRGLSLSASLAPPPPPPPASLQFPHCSLVSPAVVVVSLSGTRLLFFSSSSPCSPSAPSADICPSALHFRRDST